MVVGGEVSAAPPPREGVRSLMQGLRREENLKGGRAGISPSFPPPHSPPPTLSCVCVQERTARSIPPGKVQVREGGYAVDLDWGARVDAERQGVCRPHCPAPVTAGEACSKACWENAVESGEPENHRESARIRQTNEERPPVEHSPENQSPEEQSSEEQSSEEEFFPEELLPELLPEMLLSEERPPQERLSRKDLFEGRPPMEQPPCGVGSFPPAI
ncbi:hypothetical protein P7K49_038873 [Saguinus oedipus]|uniref:Uncharacterized protein n=1 Tax=Saguinus oedipus TaxID=9490 RepID=A0ABQ9TFW2_SAGOE|nr:hypothetical protein P7K49_038873 [Saguinus oedipus]